MLTVRTSRYSARGGDEDMTLKPGVDVNDGNWHYVTATRIRETGEKVIYVDGELQR